MKSTNAAAVDSRLQLSIFAQTLDVASPFKLLNTVQNMLPRTFTQANPEKMAIKAVL
jgi:hypothetical protein